MDNSLLIQKATLIDGTGKPPKENCTIVVKDGKFAHIYDCPEGADKGLRENPDLPVIDAEGCYLLPGLMDLHIHLDGYSLKDHIIAKYWHMTTAKALKLLHAVNNASQVLDCGFTTLRFMGMYQSMDIHLREAINLGLVRGPRLLCSGQQVTMTAGHWDLFTPNWALREPGETSDGIDECLKAVRRLVREGADFVKIHSSGGLMSPSDKVGWRNYTYEETKAICDEAHAFDMRVAAHAGGREGIKVCLDAGVDTIEHGYYLGENDDLIEQMIKQGAFLIPTVAVTDACKNHAASTGAPAGTIAKGQAAYEAHQNSIYKAYKAGVKMGSASDAYNLLKCWDLGREFAILERVGIKPLDIIKFATLGSADAIGRMNELGSIEEGKIADLILLNCNPLENMDKLGSDAATPLVVLAGKVVKNNLEQ